jgi:hypothetical protein
MPGHSAGCRATARRNGQPPGFVPLEKPEEQGQGPDHAKTAAEARQDKGLVLFEDLPQNRVGRQIKANTA